VALCPLICLPWVKCEQTVSTPPVTCVQGTSRDVIRWPAPTSMAQQLPKAYPPNVSLMRMTSSGVCAPWPWENSVSQSQAQLCRMVPLRPVSQDSGKGGGTLCTAHKTAQTIPHQLAREAAPCRMVPVEVPKETMLCFWGRLILGTLSSWLY
jgi:hypothetical protein